MTMNPNLPTRPNGKQYRIDFALIVLTGNITRYKIVRPLVENDPTIRSRWYPIRTWFAEDPLRILPGNLRLRLRQTLDSRGLFLQKPPQAVVVHAFETYYLYALLKKVFHLKTILVNNPDGGVGQSVRPLSRRLYHLAVEQTDLFVLWSNWGIAESRLRYPNLPESKMRVLHPGINLSQWPMRVPHEPGERFKLLFVGGDAPRKGLDTLLEAFETKLSATCELAVATQSGYLTPELRAWIERLPHAKLYLDLTSSSEQLKQLFQETDCFVLPTTRDVSSWVAIESLATGVPVIITSCGGIPDIVVDGETGLLVPPKDLEAIVTAVEKLRASPELREKLVRQGRAHIEAHFDAQKNTPLLMSYIKELIDAREAASGKADPDSADSS